MTTLFRDPELVRTADIRHEAEVGKRRKMPEQKPGRSKQDYGTEPALITAIEKRFGKLHIDLAGDERNKKVQSKHPDFVKREET